MLDLSLPIKQNRSNYYCESKVKVLRNITALFHQILYVFYGISWEHLSTLSNATYTTRDKYQRSNSQTNKFMEDFIML